MPFSPRACALAALTASAALVGCDASSVADGAATADATVAASLGAASAAPHDVDEALDGLALALARSLGDESVRRAVHAAVNERFNGAPEVLLKDLQDRGVGGATFRGKLVAAIARGRGVSAAEAGRALGRIAAVSGRLDVAVPVRLAEWDPSSYVPLVAFEPTGVPEDRIDRLKAYDADGDVHYLDARTAPDRPVVVVGLNERTDESGRVRPEYLVPAGTNVLGAGKGSLSGSVLGARTNELQEECAPDALDCSGGGGGTGGGGTTPPNRQGNHPETLQRISILNDHEIWSAEPAEIWTMVGCSSYGKAFKSRLGDPEPEFTLLYAGKDSQGRFLYKERTADLAVQGIYYFTWNPSSYGSVCGHELWEDDGGGSTTVTTTFNNPDTGVSFGVSDTRPNDNQEMGTVSILYSNALTQVYGTSDFQIDMR